MIEMGGSRNRCSRARIAAVLLLAAATGCATNRPRVDAALRASRPVGGPASPAAAYPVACPDLLDLQVYDHPEWSGPYEVGPDGCIQLAEVSPLRVEGLNPTQVAKRVAVALHLSSADVGARVAAYRSRQLFLFGQVEGPERALPYQGPETVADLLRRAGGLPPGADFRAVSVVRPHVAAGHRPEVFTIDLAAILLRGDSKSNVVLQPDDEVYIPETSHYSMLKALPPWMHLREWYDKLTR
jgi:polysaccharide export outer membrane protein